MRGDRQPTIVRAGGDVFVYLGRGFEVMRLTGLEPSGRVVPVEASAADRREDPARESGDA